MLSFFGGRVICVKCSERSFGVRLFFFFWGGGAYASSLVYIEYMRVPHLSGEGC